MKRTSEPPVILDSTRVLFYAETGGDATYTGRITIFTGYKDDLRKLGPVARLAICEELATGGFLVMHCDSSWKVLAVQAAPSVDAAKARAEAGYTGISSKWIEYRSLTQDELAEVEEERKALRQLSKEYPLDGNDPHAV